MDVIIIPQCPYSNQQDQRSAEAGDTLFLKVGYTELACDILYDIPIPDLQTLT
jgi:hypothetical protein